MTKNRFKLTPQAREEDNYDAGFQFSAELASTIKKPAWLVNELLVGGQPIVIGAPKKSLKTSIAIDLAISVATGTPFLGKFAVPNPKRVAMISGESGWWVTSETAARVCKARGIDWRDTDVLWSTRLPHLANPLHLSKLGWNLFESDTRLLIIDSLYLSLLAGRKARRLDAANLFQIGPLLMELASACDPCSLVVLHHATKGAEDCQLPTLEGLAYAGTQEFFRQWLLLNRRAKYNPGSPGEHKLWMVAGGSAGHSSSWAVDISEGSINEEFDGRRWDVSVRPAAEAHQEAADARKEEKKRQKQERDEADGQRVLLAIDAHADESGAAVWSKVKQAVGMNTKRLNEVVSYLKQEELAEPCPTEVATGKGLKAKKTVQALRRLSIPLAKGCLTNDRTDRTTRTVHSVQAIPE